MRLIPSLIVLLSVCFAGSDARGTPTNVEKARKLFTRAQGYYSAGNYPRALAAYNAAWTWAKRPSILFNIAQCHRQLGSYAKAISFYERYIRHWRAQNRGKRVPHYGEVKQHIAALKAKLKKARQRPDDPKVEIDRPLGKLRLTGLPAGAKVFVDGKLQEGAGEPFELAAGTRQLRVETSSGSLWAKTVVIAAGALHDARVEIATAPPPTPKPQSSSSNIWLWVGIGAGAFTLVSGITSIALYVAGNKKQVGSDALGSYRAAGYAFYAITAIAAAGTATALTLYFLRDKERPPASVGIAPLRGGAFASGSISF